MIKALDHNFRPFGSVEMICMDCGYVIWTCTTPEEVSEAIVSISGEKWYCGHAWHKFIKESDLNEN